MRAALFASLVVGVTPFARVSTVFTRKVFPFFVAVMSGYDEPLSAPPGPGMYSSGAYPPP